MASSFLSDVSYHVRLTIACCCCGNAPNPADAVAIGGPLEPFEGKCLKVININKNVTIEVVFTAKTVRLSDLLLAGPKLRLLARLARLESRSPVTSLLSVVGVVADSGDTIGLTPAVRGGQQGT